MKILMLLKSSLDNDSRVKKEMKTLMSLGYRIRLISVSSKRKLSEIEHVIIAHEARRRVLPGVSAILLQFRLLYNAIKHKNDIDVVHCHDLNTLHAGVLIKLVSKDLKLIYDTHEFAINDIPNQSWVSIKMKYYLEKCLIRYADQVIVVSDSIANEYVKLYGIKKPNLVLNCPLYTHANKKDLFRKKFNIRQNQRIFLYQGGLSKGRGIEMLLQAFISRQDDNCVLVCMGYGVLEHMVKEHEKSSQNIFFHPAVDQNELLNYTGSADIGLLFYEDSCLNHEYCSPNKIFEYIMAGLPVITANLIEMTRLVQSEGLGLVVESNTVEGVKNAINEITKLNLGEFSDKVQLASRKYCWETQETSLAKAYQGIGA